MPYFVMHFFWARDLGFSERAPLDANHLHSLDVRFGPQIPISTVNIALT